MDIGFIEIGNIMRQASSEVIRKLKSILDQHDIFHISDGVFFQSPHRNGDSRRAIPHGRTKEGLYTKKYLHRDKQITNDLNHHRELIVPDLYEPNLY